MNKRLGRRYFIAILALALPACASSADPADEETLAQADAQRPDAVQVKTQVVGKTGEWVHGGAYYSTGGRLQVKWRKSYLRGNWEVSGDGLVRYQLPRWEKRCHFYMQLDGRILMLDEGRNIGSRRMFEGNRLARVGVYEPGPGPKALRPGAARASLIYCQRPPVV